MNKFVLKLHGDYCMSAIVSSYDFLTEWSVSLYRLDVLHLLVYQRGSASWGLIPETPWSCLLGASGLHGSQIMTLFEPISAFSCSVYMSAASSCLMLCCCSPYFSGCLMDRSQAFCLIVDHFSTFLFRHLFLFITRLKPFICVFKSLFISKHKYKTKFKKLKREKKNVKKLCEMRRNHQRSL